MITVGYISKDRPHHLRASLDTVGRQTVKPDKVIIADCSKDVSEIEKIIKEFTHQYKIPCDLQWRPEEISSRSKNRQIGIEMATTPIVISTECDVLWPENILELAIKAIDGGRKKVYIQPWIAAYQENGILGPIYKKHRCGFFQCFRKIDADAVGGYNTLLTNWGWDDVSIKIRLLAYGCEEITLPIVVKHQWHPKVANDAENKTNQEIDNNSYFDTKDRTWKLKDGFQI